VGRRKAARRDCAVKPTNLHWISAKSKHSTASIPQSFFAYGEKIQLPLHKGALGATAPAGFLTRSNRHPVDGGFSVFSLQTAP